jgi:hypothetical protein
MRILPYLSLAMLWLVSRLVAMGHAEFWQQWDIWQARKLVELGFAATGGALTAPLHMAGQMPHVADLAYTNHPYPGVWLYALLYALGGAGLCFAFLLGLKLAGVAACYALLERAFDRRSAWLATAFFILAPAAMTMDVESNIISVASTLWPLAALLALAAGQGRVRAGWLGLFVFVGAQISWFFLMLVPALVWLALPPDAAGRAAWRRAPRWPPALAVLVGAGLAAAVFAAQFAHYVPDLDAAVKYLHAQAGGAPEVPRARMAIAVVLRHAFFLGPGLLLGVLALAGPAPASAEGRRLREACAFFALVFVVAELALLRFAFIEVSPYTYLLFPCAALTAAFLARGCWRPLAALASVAALALAVLAAVRGAVPRVTHAARAVGPALARHTQPHEVLFTNLRDQHPPYDSWDTNGRMATSLLADRLTFYDVTRRDQARTLAAGLKRNFTGGVYVFAVDAGDGGDLLAALRARGNPSAEEIVTPAPQPQPPGARLRTWIWKLTGRYADRGADERAATPVRLQFYRFTPELIQ